MKSTEVGDFRFWPMALIKSAMRVTWLSIEALLAVLPLFARHSCWEAAASLT
jgi:hypothetical protein